MTEATSSTRIVDGREVPVVGTWNLDPTHTTIEFVARHLMVTKVRGSFTDFSGTFTVAEDPTQSTVDVAIQLASVHSGTDDRDNHLKSPDFFDVENNPVMTFKSTEITPAGDAWKLTGDLTIKGITKPVTLDMEFLGVMNDPWGNAKAAFSASGEISREDWGLTWNVPLEGGVLVSKQVKIEIETQAAIAS